MDEQQIIAGMLRKDEASMDAFLRQYGPLLRYVIAPLVPDERDREDVLSESVLRVWQNIGQFDTQKGSWRAWVTTIARNTALNHLRGNRATEPLSEDMPAAGAPEEAVLQQERQEALRRALEQLSTHDRTLFYRKYYYRQPTAQIAAELGATPRAIEGRLYRLKKHLRKLLGGALDD